MLFNCLYDITTLTAIDSHIDPFHHINWNWTWTWFYRKSQLSGDNFGEHTEEFADGFSLYWFFHSWKVARAWEFSCDHFTRCDQTYLTTNQTAKQPLRVSESFCSYGFPAQVHNGQGANWGFPLIKNLCQSAGVIKSRDTPYKPVGDGMVCRFNQTLHKMVVTLKNWRKRWLEVTHWPSCPYLQYNSSSLYKLFGLLMSGC